LKQHYGDANITTVFENGYLNAVIVQNKEQFEKTNQTVNLATIQNSFEKFRTGIITSSTKFFRYESYPENIILNITETSVNLSTIKGKI
jgi:hypothetical protein